VVEGALVAAEAAALMMPKSFVLVAVAVLL